jgi:hypothetical protein
MGQSGQASPSSASSLFLPARSSLRLFVPMTGQPRKTRFVDNNASCCRTMSLESTRAVVARDRAGRRIAGGKEKVYSP